MTFASEHWLDFRLSALRVGLWQTQVQQPPELSLFKPECPEDHWQSLNAIQ
jgi:hypothetical protein